MYPSKPVKMLLQIYFVPFVFPMLLGNFNVSAAFKPYLCKIKAHEPIDK